MADGLFSSVELEPGGRAGFRLQHVEVFNWGTFDKRVWRLTPGGETALLTGDIGSGKSTLVDAVTTLLLPAHRISYNKAAGAESKERTLRSYVEGHYKSERVEATGASRAVGLRADPRSFSVVLGVFVNDGYDEVVTLAAVFQQRDRTGQPYRFFVTSGKELGIAADFTDFGSDLSDLRRRLRAGGAQLFDEFTTYSSRARRLLAITSEQAMELFHQTVSMKSVGNLNEFVRSHMLEPVEASDRVKGIVGHFEDLTKAHEAVRRARDQLEALGPLAATADRFDDALVRRGDAERQRDAIRLYFAELQGRLLTAEIREQRTLREDRAAAAEVAEQRRIELTREREGLIADRATAGGDRIAELERVAVTARHDVAERRARRARFDGLLEAAQLSPILDHGAFSRMPALLDEHTATATARRGALDVRLVDLSGRQRDLARSGDETRAELTSLAGRTNNLPSSQLDLRAQLCRDLDLGAELLPFAGELLDLAEPYAQWRGAAERVLRGFALSMLVPDEHYALVSRWVNEHRLTHRRGDGSLAGIRLVYERVPARQIRLQVTPSAGGLTLADCLDVKDGPLAGYLTHELVRRADHRCAESQEEFRAERRAVTREGQVRSGDRHEKDDRSRVDDPRTWVLGWVNERKVAALAEQLAGKQSELLALRDDLTVVQRDRDGVSRHEAALAGLAAFPSWGELDWEEAETRATSANAERERLVSGSSALAEIERRLADNDAASRDVDDRVARLGGDVRVLDDRIERGESALAVEETVVATTSDTERALARTTYADLEARLGQEPPRTADECGPAATRLTDTLHRVLDQIGKEIGGYSSSLVSEMSKILTSWPELRSEMDASVGALPDFRAFHDRVAGDDLPRFEADFKEQLNTNTIRELAGFNHWLNRQADEIQARVERINEAMGAIDYSPGRYIRLEKERTVNQEIQQFRHDLREVTRDAVTPDDDPYSEQRFLDVQRIIERFRGRDHHAEADRAWARRVTDVRNWFTFSASERDRATDAEWEHYRDSDGKSGGQKEKLAYTILAASLAYQFGLEWGATRSRDFRFAVIDEAFGRGSDASTRYALELFAKLGLQLLIVTPLQKVHVIEPYVRAIGFVDNPSGHYSRLQTLTIEEFHQRRDAQS